MNPVFVCPGRRLANHAAVFGAVVYASMPVIVIRQPFQKMIEVQIIYPYPIAADIGWVKVNQIVVRGKGHHVLIERPVWLTVIEDSGIGLFDKLAEVFFKGRVPGGLVAKRAFDIGQPDVQIATVEQVVRPLDEAELIEREKGQRTLAGISEMAVDVLHYCVEPGIFIGGEVDIAKRIGNKRAIGIAGIAAEDQSQIVVAQSGSAILDQGQANSVIEGQQVVVGHTLSGLFEAIGNSPRPTKGIQHRMKVKVLHTVPYPIGQPTLTALIAGGRENGNSSGLIQELKSQLACLLGHRYSLSSSPSASSSIAIAQARWLS